MEKSKEWVVRVATEVTLSFSSEEPIDVDTLLSYFKAEKLKSYGVVNKLSEKFAYVVSTEPVGEVIEQDSTD